MLMITGFMQHLAHTLTNSLQAGVKQGGPMPAALAQVQQATDPDQGAVCRGPASPDQLQICHADAQCLSSDKDCTA